MLHTQKETSDATLMLKKRGRPVGSKNKPKIASIKRGRPVGSTNKPKESTKAKRGRPVGSLNKTKAIPAVPTKPTTIDIPVTQKSTRGRSVGSKNIHQSDVPQVAYTLEPIHGFNDLLHKWGDNGYMTYQVSATSMELKAEDMPKAVQKYVDRYGILPTRAILHERNEKLLPYLNAQVPDIEVGLTMGGTALWEIQFQIPYIIPSLNKHKNA